MSKRPAGRRTLPLPWPILVLILVVLGAAGYSLIAPATAQAEEHPTPHAGVDGSKVLPPEQFADDAQVAQVYAEASKIAPVLDGIYCHCNCHHSVGHYSLLSCFESDHGSMCGTCMGEAHMAYEMSQRGASLDEIRKAVDLRFG